MAGVVQVADVESVDILIGRFHQQRKIEACPKLCTSANNKESKGVEHQDYELPSSLFRYRPSNRITDELRFMAMRFSKLSSFNDPFDGQLLSKRSFSDDDFLAALRLEADRHLQDGRLVQPSADANSVQMLLWFYSQTQDPKLSREGFLDGLIALLREKGVSFGPNDFERGVIHALADTLRCMCFSKSKSHLLMWAHYGENHRGAVVEFKVPSESEMLRDPKAVNYSPTIPDSGEVVDFVMPVLGIPLANKNSVDRLLYTKGIDWAYEEEWRVVADSKLVVAKEGLSRFTAADVIGVYLGCRMDIAVRRELLDIIDENYPHATIFQAQKNEQKYALDFVPIRLPGRSLREIDSDFPDQLLALYSQCTDMFFRGLNDPLGAREAWKVECLCIDAALIAPVPREIRIAFRAMLDSADKYALQRREERASFTPSPTSEIEKRQALRLAALPFKQFHELADRHLRIFERKLNPI